MVSEEIHVNQMQIVPLKLTISALIGGIKKKPGLKGSNVLINIHVIKK